MNLNINDIVAAANANNNAVRNGEQRSKAKFWLNVGILANLGEGERFVSIGGFALDDLKPMSGQSAFASVQAGLLQAVKAKAEALAPGEDAYLDAGNFRLQIKHVGESRQAEVPSDLAAKLASLFA